MPHNPTMKKPPRPAQKRGGWAVLLFALVTSVAGTLSPATLHAARNAAPGFELVTFSGEAYSKDSLREASPLAAELDREVTGKTCWARVLSGTVLSAFSQAGHVRMQAAATVRRAKIVYIL